jgi:hypothetical protein
MTDPTGAGRAVGLARRRVESLRGGVSMPDRSAAPLRGTSWRDTNMIRDGFHEIYEALDDHEELCVAGVFALAAAGWTLLYRRRFGQIGTARRWAECEIAKLRPLHLRCHWTILTAEDPETLEDVLTVYEAARRVKDFSSGA